MAEDKSIDSIEFTKRLLQLTNSNWVDAAEFHKLPELIGLQPGEAKVDFCQRLIAIIKRMPDKLIDVENKEKLLVAAQEFLDEVIEEEEEHLDK